MRKGDIEGVRERFVQYSTAQGEVLPGLLKRRLAELDWIGSGTQGAERTAQAATLAGPAPALQAPLQSGFGTGSGSIAPLVPTAAPAATDRREVASTLRDHLAGISSSEPTDARSAQNLSRLITLLFDLQMRAAVDGPKDASTDTDAATPASPQHAI